MSNYILAKRASLYDATGKWVGLLDLNGKEQIVDSSPTPPYTVGESYNLYDSTGALIGVLDRNGKEQILAASPVPPYRLSETPFLFDPSTGQMTGVLDSLGREMTWPTTSIGGVQIGTAGTGIYSGFRLAGGDDFNTLSLIKQADPNGYYFPSHRRRGARGINSAFDDYYWTPDHTGHDDANRGVPYAAANDLLTNSGGRVFMKTRLATAGEKAIAWTTSSANGPQRPQSSSAFHSAGYQAVKWPCIVEAKVRMPLSSEGANGMWNAFWLENMLPPWPNSGEWDWEWTNTNELRGNFITGTSGGDTNDAIANTVVATMDDASDHIVTMVAQATTLKFYVDGSLVATASRRPTDIVNGPMFWWLRSGVGNWQGMSYSPANWAGKAPVMQVDWVRIWTQPTSSDLGYKGVVQTINVDFASSFNVTLPSMVSLWGSGSFTEWLIVQPFEDAAPGMSQVPQTTNYGDWYGQTPANNYAGPTICAWNKTTRAFTGSGFDRAGRMFAHLVAWDDTNGGLAGIARVIVNVGPKLKVSSVQWLQGQALSYDLYAQADCGMLTTDGTAKAKTISVSGLPAGLSYSDTTGLITGTPSAAGSGTLTVTITNSIGQSVTATPSYQVTSGVVAPTLTGSPTLLASWDPNNAGTVATTGGLVDSLSGADGTSFTLTGTSTTRPTLTARSGKNVLNFTAASGTFLQAASNLGLTTQCTFVVIAEMKDTAGNYALIDVADGAGAAGVNRHSLVFLNAGSGGYQHRNCGSSIEVDATSLVFNTSLHLVVSQSRGIDGSAGSNIWMDGAAIGINQPTTQAASGLNTTTLGARRAAGAQSLPANGYVYRVLVYASGSLSATNREEIAVWANSNYGTANNA